MKPLFSFALIARNESKTLPRLISSLIEYKKRGGEVIVLDTGSTDDTAEVARMLGCTVHEVGDKFRISINEQLAHDINNHFIVDNETPVVTAGDSLFDFASARNYIAELAPTDFIFTPDCDEIWTKFDIDAINQKITEGVEQLEYEFVFSHDILGNPVIKFKHSKAYDRRKLRWVGIIHEVLSGDANRLYVDESIAKLEHYQNVETNRSGYLKGLAVDCFKNPQNDRNSHYFAREMMYLKRYKSAIKEFKRHIEMNGWDQEKAQSMLYIGDCYKELGDIDEMLKWYIKSIDFCPTKREPLMRLAEYYFSKNNYKQTILFATAALEIAQAPFYSNYQPYYEHLPHELLYCSYWYEGNIEKSKYHFDKAFDFSPKNPKIIEEMKFYYPKVSIVIPTLGRPDGLQRCLDSIKKLNYSQKLIEVIVKDGEGTVPNKVKEMTDNSTGEYICYAANDMEFTPDSLLCAVRESQEKNKGLVSFYSGPLYEDNGNICEHFIIKKELLPKIGGEIFDTDFHHVGVDNLLWEKCVKINEAYHSEKSIVNHYHFSKGSNIDDIYKKGWDNVEKDRALLKHKLQEL